MDIGDVVSLNIDDVDRACIVLSKKSWIELDDEWLESDPRIFIFMHSTIYQPGLFACQQYRAPMYISNDDSEICCELMYGDTKAWIRDIELQKFGKEV